MRGRFSMESSWNESSWTPAHCRRRHDVGDECGDRDGYWSEARAREAAPVRAAKGDLIIGVPFPVFVYFSRRSYRFLGSAARSRSWGQPCAKDGSELVHMALNKRWKAEQ